MPALPLLPAELAWYVTGRFYRAGDESLADYGYFVHLAGIEGDLFAGARGEGTAHFTFAATPFTAKPIANGELNLSVDAIGDFALYLQRTPAGNFDDPASFAQGERIATFRRTSLVVDTTNGPAITNVFSARLVSSEPFEFAGQRHDLADIVGHGITQFGTAAITPILPTPPGYKAVIPFTGSALALAGGKQA